MNWLQKLAGNILKATYDINTPKGKVTVTILVDRQQFAYWYEHKNARKYNQNQPDTLVQAEPDVTLIIEPEDADWLPDEPDPPTVLDMTDEEREQDDVFSQEGRRMDAVERDRVDMLVKWNDIYPDLMHYFMHHFQRFPGVQGIYEQVSGASFVLREEIYQQYIKGPR